MGSEVEILKMRSTLTISILTSVTSVRFVPFFSVILIFSSMGFLFFNSFSDNRPPFPFPWGSWIGFYFNLSRYTFLIFFIVSLGFNFGLKNCELFWLEIMASSLNGLTVGDPLQDNLMESPARSDTMFFARWFFFTTHNTKMIKFSSINTLVLELLCRFLKY